MRAGTRDAHDKLDQFMRHTGWQDRASYGTFLQVQYAARLPIEQYFAQLPMSDDIPPAQAPLIRQDLVQMGLDLPTQGMPRFDLPKQANRGGAFWAIAGSSLGNKAILREIERSPGGKTWPAAFLSDGSMTDYWKTLRLDLNKPADQETTAGAIKAAKAVFAHFHWIAQRISLEHAE
ncbi:MAG: biliverdin-producing heme oxygenase [Erythrobacter sp.]